MTMTPEACYQNNLSKDGFSKDSAQEQAIQHLQALYDQLLLSTKPPLHQRISSLLSKRSTPVRGLYFWGGVGRGKTYLMDTFYHCLPFSEKLRMHFHHFMRRVHNELKNLEGQKNPLKSVAKLLAGEARVICFDEFFVSDITDAMILSRLMEQLFNCGVTLVATSNVEPNQLYKEGLQRNRFLPAIDLINKHTLVINVDGGIDYRLRLLEKADTYYCPISHETNSQLRAIFHDLAPDADLAKEHSDIDIFGRTIKTVKLCEDIAWFSFAQLCDGPRSQNDYIELARLFHSVILESVPQFRASTDEQARRFINLVDEFYDRGVKLIISSKVDIDQLYTEGSLSFEFRRTQSRLQEMQSTEYMARPHKP